jgi:hypothetical protein
MKRFWNSRVAHLSMLIRALAVSVAFTASASAAKSPPPPPVDEAQLLALGFKVLVATTPAQTDWVKHLAPGQMRPMQRTGKHYFIYPDAARNRIFVGGPQEYQAYRKLHPEDDSIERQRAQETAGREYRAQQSDTMKKATARDLSDPYLGLSWTDLGW